MVQKAKTKVDSETKKIANRELKDIEELVLPSSKLKFCSEQLQNLNYMFTKKLSAEPDLEYTKALLLAKSVTERLIQRLACGVGMLDTRFASKFLIALHNQQSWKSCQSLEYLIRLDALSKPSLYESDHPPKYSIIENDIENCPSGYARLRLQPATSRIWSDFVNASGFLRRDKIQAKYVELLAVAAAKDVPNSPTAVDESLFCGCPGKIVDPLTLHKILRQPPEEHIFYGAAGNTPRFPDPRDFKLAIVDEPNGIRLRVGFLSPALSAITIEVRLLIAIGLDVWPSSTNFPFRIPLGHSDCILYHRAAQTGFYLSGFGVHSSAWQIRVPAAEWTLENNYSENSAVTSITQTLEKTLQEVHSEYRKHHLTYQILNSYILKTALFYELEKDLSSPTETIIKWSPKYLSTHVLKILDSLVSTLKNQRQPNYFFPSANLLVNPGHLSDDDFTLESNKIRSHMLKLFDESLVSLKSNLQFRKFLVSQHTELSLLNKWKELIDGLMPPPSTRGRRICFAGSRFKQEVVYTQYTTRQLEYIGILLKNMLVVKQTVLQSQEDFPWLDGLRFPHDLQEDPLEDVIYILVTIVEQARDKFLENLPRTATVDLTRSKLRREFDLATAKLIDLIRKEKEITKMEFIDDITMVKIILKWLYKGLDHNKKSLAPVLRPYLRVLFVTSHGASWHLEAIKQQEVEDEATALGTFAKLVNKGTITPAQGLVDSISKNWNWAKSMLRVIEEENIRLIFVPERGKISKHILYLPEDKTKETAKNFDDLKIEYVHPEWSTLQSRCYLSIKLLKTKEVGTSEDYVPFYCTLRDGSPFSLIYSQINRRGEHRCSGDILQSLFAMQKVNVVQEVSTLLPNDERIEILEAIQKLVVERGKRTVHKKKSNSFIQLARKKAYPEVFSEDQREQKYTPKEESAGIKEVSGKGLGGNGKEAREKENFRSNRWKKESFLKNGGSLIGSCRAARIREDNSILHFQDNFRINSLIKHSSFKY